MCSKDVLKQVFRADSYRVDICWSDMTDTELMVRGKAFDDSDRDTLELIAPPIPFPLFQVIKVSAAAT